MCRNALNEIAAPRCGRRTAPALVRIEQDGSGGINGKRPQIGLSATGPA